MSFIIIYTTHSNEESAEKLSNLLIEEKYIACSNSFPIKSAYWWKGVVENEHEFVAILKTIPENWKAVQIKIESLHSYETPCIIKIDVEANAAYEQWIRNEVEVKKE